MPREFDTLVRDITTAIQSGKILLAEPVIRSFKRRWVSVGPYRQAVGHKTYAICGVGGPDCTENRSARRIALDFVRYVGKDKARTALAKVKAK
jgi:hypothetical protein